MSELSPILALPFIQPSQAQKHVTHNEALRSLDVLVQLTVADRTRTTPPATPAEGDRHIVAAGAISLWAGTDGQIAVWDNGGWQFHDPLPGWRAEVIDEALEVVHDGTDWIARETDFDNLSGVGINTTSDNTNRLAVAAAATLLTHDGADHQLKINKATDADTASLLFQSGWTGHAEMGLAGTTDFSIKVSLDGSAWHTAIQINKATGAISGTAVQSDPLDTTPTRLMKVKAFGLGNTGTAPLMADLDATDIASGSYYYAAATANVANRPATAAGTGTIVVTRAFASTCTQILTENIGTAIGGDTWYRTYQAAFGAWAGWRLLYTPENIVGSVAETGGTPTGAVIERSANANGEYVRFADGTQICTTSMSMSSAAAETWTFPAAFIAAPSVCGTVEAVVLSALTLDSAPTSSTATLSVRDKTDARRADTTHLTATGRWF